MGAVTFPRWGNARQDAGRAAGPGWRPGQPLAGGRGRRRRRLAGFAQFQWVRFWGCGADRGHLGIAVGD